MQTEIRGRLARWAGFGVIALAAIVGQGAPSRAEAVADAGTAAADRGAIASLTEKALIEQHGRPRHRDADSVTWYGPGDWKKTVLYKSGAGGGMIAQTVDYRVPKKKMAALQEFDDRITVDKRRGELTVRTDSERTNFLIANLAHEVASGFKSPGEARIDYITQMHLADAGKSSSYLDSLRFVTKTIPPTEPSIGHPVSALNWPTPQNLPDGKYTPRY